jgi:hypothetical protein
MTKCEFGALGSNNAEAKRNEARPLVESFIDGVVQPAPTVELGMPASERRRQGRGI